MGMLATVMNSLAIAGGTGNPYFTTDSGAALRAFMRTGDPNCKELPAWPAYDPDTAPTIIGLFRFSDDDRRRKFRQRPQQILGMCL